MTGSLAYRKNESAIKRGEVPEKYTRLLPFITGERILEIGSAEGVLALLMARMGKQVIALEKSEERHEAASQLYAEWLGREKQFSAPRFVNGTIQDNLSLLEHCDTLVAVRSIYYLRDNLDRVFSKAAETVKTVILCGNGNRARRWRSGISEETNADNFYASREGMTELLKRHGYRITQEVREGDEVVVGGR
jgi:SAM-dependent methyltransferase